MPNTTKILLPDLTFDELRKIIKRFGAEPFRTKQIYEWVYKKFAGSFDEMTDLPKKLRDKLKKEITFTHLEPQIDLLSSDGWTRKILFGLPDKSQVETVLMGYEKRRTACISTQAGCGLGCTFCATGQAGLQRNITAGEIIDQVMFFERSLHRQKKQNTSPSPLGRVEHYAPREGLTNLVFMGMGEPFANYKEVMKSIEILTNPDGYNFGARRITISTVGLVPMIEKFTEENSQSLSEQACLPKHRRRQVNLAISLHAATDELRETMLPINKKYPLEVLIPACLQYTLKTRRRISFEWALINGVNDTPEQAKLLAKLLKDMLCHVNFIPLNPTKGYEGSESRSENIKKFREILDNSGIPNTLRIRRGIDIHASCGQLRQEAQKPTLSLPRGGEKTIV